jgi:hypothetical protein
MLEDQPSGPIDSNMTEDESSESEPETVPTFATLGQIVSQHGHIFTDSQLSPRVLPTPSPSQLPIASRPFPALTTVVVLGSAPPTLRYQAPPPTKIADNQTKTPSPTQESFVTAPNSPTKVINKNPSPPVKCRSSMASDRVSGPPVVETMIEALPPLPKPTEESSELPTPISPGEEVPTHTQKLRRKATSPTLKSLCIDAVKHWNGQGNSGVFGTVEVQTKCGILDRFWDTTTLMNDHEIESFPSREEPEPTPKRQRRTPERHGGSCNQTTPLINKNLNRISSFETPVHQNTKRISDFELLSSGAAWHHTIAKKQDGGGGSGRSSNESSPEEVSLVGYPHSESPVFR